ncbi:phosphatase PAP2 family protein [Thauera sp. 2A1]|uniref:phosphatase PAP2 family protein n=1 Tax=Thauera sp. 2A1 TaxID=2570191 RepID=UPI001291D559|nr:phosphatase PAP2 family protein [Thauera sp. 2A1]KAI5913664.1 phosphatase PAP2 family protein [Thauera sp. 2A1]
MSRQWLELRFLGGVLAAASAMWLFIEVAEEVVEGDARAIDTAILMFFRTPADPVDPVGPRWLEDLARDLTALGSPVVLGIIVGVTCLFLLLAGRHRTSLFVLGATASGGIASTLLKLSFNRPRPDLVPHTLYVSSASFPSGHAMISALVYLTLGALVARLVRGRRLKLYVLSVAVLLSGLVGLTRVYLGVHWPSDVVGGWAAGAAWALGWWAAAQLIHLGEETEG